MPMSDPGPPPRPRPPEARGLPRVELETRERLTIRIPFDELVDVLTTDTRFELRHAEDRHGRLLDWPEAWDLADVSLEGLQGASPHLALYFELTETRPLGVDL